MLNNEIDKIKDALAKDKEILFAYLFGSRTNGMVSERSDWDIAVYLTDNTEPMPSKAFYIEAVLARLLRTDDVQIIILNNLDAPLLGFEIIKNNMLLVDKDEEGRIEFEARILNQYHDWQYFSKRHMDAEGWAV
ncbi:MAG: nucleotidyltransferase domain-containing protein [Deltaproteobacteria bacterium]|nr:nucleotidyltransferase domain-containing protein [Deltaproteobacteria bacterium]